MSNVNTVVNYRGRSLGIIILTAAQLLVGVIHVFFGLWLLIAGSLADSAISAQSPLVYSVYTLVFGLLTLVFAVGIWLRTSWGWIGTFAVSLFVIVADALTLVNLPSIPGIPPSAAGVEIIYSLLVLLYLSQTHVRIKYHIS
jgi:hypothetical protein